MEAGPGPLAPAKPVANIPATTGGAPPGAMDEALWEQARGAVAGLLVRQGRQTADAGEPSCSDPPSATPVGPVGNSDGHGG